MGKTIKQFIEKNGFAPNRFAISLIDVHNLFLSRS
jgi:hypothetical protein